MVDAEERKIKEREQREQEDAKAIKHRNKKRDHHREARTSESSSDGANERK
jgi:hypothetical protein